MKIQKLKDTGHFIRFGLPLPVIGFLFFFECIAYWPLTTFLFSLKNDAIHYFLPVRFSISEAIRGGELPYWSPFLYMGYPLNGDLQSGAFNPVLWLISMLHRYTIYSLHLETFFYLFLASVGAYKLLSGFGFHAKACLATAAIYPLTGFFTDSGQNIAWIANAAFLPFAFYYFSRILSEHNPSNGIKLGLSLFFLLVAGYPFYFIYTVYLFLAWTLFFLVTEIRSGNKTRIKSFSIQAGLAALVFFCLGLAPLVHFVQFLPYYSRGSGLSLEYALTNSLPPVSLLSLVFPYAMQSEHFLLNIDPGLRNSYVGMLFIPFIFIAAFSRKGKNHLFFLFLLLISLLLSLGDSTPLREWAYRYLPFMNTFRHPANFRIFTTMGLLFLGGAGLSNNLYRDSKTEWQKLKPFLFLLLVLIAGTLILFWPSPFQFSHSNNAGSIRDYIFGLNESLDFNKKIFFSGIIQLLFLAFLFIFLQKKNTKAILASLVLNALFFQQLSLVNFVSKTSARKVNTAFCPVKGFPIPDTRGQTLSPDSISPFARYSPGLKYIFRKQIVLQTDFTNPTFLKSYESFISDSSLVNRFRDYPAVFVSDLNKKPGESKKIDPTEIKLRKEFPMEIGHFGPNRFEFKTSATQNTFLGLFQNKYPFWHLYIDGNPSKPLTFAGTFMAAELPPGKHRVIFRIEPGWRKWTYAWLAFCLLAISVILFKREKRDGK